jgi:hypothetical protein
LRWWPTLPGSVWTDRLEVPSCITRTAPFAVKPSPGSFETVEDLEAQLIAGNPDEAVAECKKFEAIGVEHLVFDFRFKFDKWYDQIELPGNEVLPKLKR